MMAHRQNDPVTRQLLRDARNIYGAKNPEGFVGEIKKKLKSQDAQPLPHASDKNAEMFQVEINHKIVFVRRDKANPSRLSFAAHL